MAFRHLSNACLGFDTHKKNSLNSSDFRVLEILITVISGYFLKSLSTKNIAYNDLMMILIK